MRPPPIKPVLDPSFPPIPTFSAAAAMSDTDLPADAAAPAAEVVDIEDARPIRTTIRYTTESNRHRNRHVAVNFSAITPGDIGGLYAAVSTAITADLNRLRRESKGGSLKTSAFFGEGGSGPAQLNAIDCDLKIELCRLLDSNGTLFLPPVKDTSVFRKQYAHLQGANSQDPRDKKYDFLAFLLDQNVKSSWEHLQDGLFFEEGDGWPWYCLLVSFTNEARLDKIVKYQGRLVMADIDPQSFFPRMPTPPPSPPSPALSSLPIGGEMLETVSVSVKPRRTKTVVEPPKKPRAEKPARTTTSTSTRTTTSAKYADVRAKSKSAFSIGSLVKAQR